MITLGDDHVSMVIDAEGEDDEAILDAARACPVDAITLIDEFEAGLARLITAASLRGG